MGPKGCHLLCEGLKENQRVLSIDLSYNSIGNEGAKALASLLSTKGVLLRELRIQGNSIGEVGQSALYRALSLTYAVKAKKTTINKSCSMLQILDISNNGITIGILHSFRTFIEHNTMVNALSVNGFWLFNDRAFTSIC